MRKFTIRYKLMLLVLCLVIGSGTIITQVVTRYYGEALKAAALSDAEKTARLLALRAADKVLTNDRVGLHDLFDAQMKINPQVKYLFLVRDGRVIAHTFESGIPTALLSANAPLNADTGRIEHIVSVRDGRRYLDMAWPVFGRKAGVLRLGYGEAGYRRAISALKIRIWLITLAVLLIALFFSHLFIVRITRPISRLTGAVKGIDETNLPEKIAVSGGWEIERLVVVFNHLIGRLREYTGVLRANALSLAEKNTELDRIHHQTRMSFEISQEISVLPDLEAVDAFLTQRLGETITCKKMALLVFGSGRNRVYTCIGGHVSAIENPEAVSRASGLVGKHESPVFLSNAELPVSITDFKDAERIAFFPLFHQNEFLGAFCIGCPGDCRCLASELHVVSLILNLSAGTICRARNREEEIRELKHRLDQSSNYGGIIGKDPKMHAIYNLIEDVAPSEATVLITGESGTGKEVVAHAIHDKSGRSDGPFVVINCSTYPETLLESELFGYEKGAFTGATGKKPGRFEEAEGGTIFLDEIGEISAAAQVKLLRVLQSRKFERLGGQKTIAIEARIIAATNVDLVNEIKDGGFREDLYYRLNVIPIHIPALRHRKNDIPLLVRHFIHKFKLLHEKSLIKRIDPGAMRVLLNYDWPGNVRELENCIEHAVVLAKGEDLLLSDLPPVFRVATDGFSALPQPEETLWGTEKQHLIQVLEACDWNKTQAARRLGIGRSSLYHKLKRFRIASP
ncbi:MAG: HAMP domain-containing protein [Deltaproteobacteria bacterium]|nr:HAMP domain-containing protein [Deltaproteobacteria bacterium]